MTVKYLIKSRHGGYLCDEEWDGKSYIKNPFFIKGYSYDTIELLKKHVSVPDDHKIVKIKETIITFNSHSHFKKTITPKGKIVLRCSQCKIGNPKPRPTYELALAEYIELKNNNPCQIYNYEEVL